MRVWRYRCAGGTNNRLIRGLPRAQRGIVRYVCLRSVQVLCLWSSTTLELVAEHQQQETPRLARHQSYSGMPCVFERHPTTNGGVRWNGFSAHFTFRIFAFDVPVGAIPKKNKLICTYFWSPWFVSLNIGTRLELC